jgi:hypothetical protein
MLAPPPAFNMGIPRPTLETPSPSPIVMPASGLSAQQNGLHIPRPRLASEALHTMDVTPGVASKSSALSGGTIPHTATKAYATTAVKAWQTMAKPSKLPRTSSLDAPLVKMHPPREGGQFPRVPGKDQIAKMLGEAAIAQLPRNASGAEITGKTSRTGHIAKVQKPVVAKVQKAALL